MIEYLYLGRVGYGEALRLQEELAALRAEGRIGNVLLLLEHPPVLTLGRNAKRANILASEERLAARGITIYEINRGGDVTYHGPGQLVGYPIFDLRSLRSPSGGRLGPVDFVRLMEEALIRLCGEFGVQAGRICGLTGVWCHLPQAQNSSKEAACAAPDSGPKCEPATQSSSQSLPGDRERKIAAIGIHVARGVTSHGFAFNVTTDLRDFELINPCGITDRPVTCLAREVSNSDGLPSLEAIAHRTARQFGMVFHEEVLEAESLAALRAPAAAAPSGAPEFPAQDTPLQIPREVERLRGVKSRPVRA